MAGALALRAVDAHGRLIFAHQPAPASVLPPFLYTQMPFATIVGWLVFGNLPDRWTVTRGAIVIGSGLYLLDRERPRQRDSSADVAA